MAWAMWERLDYKGMDPSVLSRLINGERVFTPRQLEVFCSLLVINEIERIKLDEYLQQDILGRFGRIENYTDPKEKYLCDFLEADLIKIEQIRARDLPILASEWIDQLYDRVHMLLPNITNTASRNRALTVLANILIERKRVEFSLRESEEMPEKLTALPDELQAISKELKSAEFSGNAYAVAGSVHFYKKNYKDSIRENERAVSLIISNIEKAVTLSRLAITYGKINKMGNYLSARDQMYKLLPSFSDDFQCYTLQMIAQGEIHAGLYKQAKRTLYKSWNLYERKVAMQKKYSAIRKIQIIRTELELAYASKEKRSKNTFEKMTTDALFLINNHGYVSFSLDVNKFWNRIA